MHFRDAIDRQRNTRIDDQKLLQTRIIVARIIQLRETNRLRYIEVFETDLLVDAT